MSVHAPPPDPAADAGLLGGLLDASTELVCACDGAGRIVHVNRAWERALGYTRAEAAELDAVALVAPEHRAAYRAAARRLLAGEAGRGLRGRAAGARRAPRGLPRARRAAAGDGARRRHPLRGHARGVPRRERRAPRRDRAGAPGRDVEATPDVVAVVAASGRLEYLNRAGRRLLGLPDAAPTPSRALHTALPPDTRARLLDEGVPAALRDGAWQGEGEVIDGAGMHVPVSIALSALPGLAEGEAPAVSAVLRDLRERVDAERALRASRAEATAHARELRTLIRAMQDVVFVLDRCGTYLEVLDTAPGLLVAHRERLLGRRVGDFFDAAQAALFLDAIRRALDEQRPTVVEYTLTLDGAAVWFDGTASPLDGDRVLFVARDVTARRAAETAWQESERRFRAALDHGEIAYAAMAPVRDAAGAVVDFEYVAVTAGFERLTGTAADDLVGGRVSELFPLSVEAGDLDVFREVLATGRPAERERRTRDPRLTARWLSAQVVPIAGGVALLARDVTRQKEAEEELRLLQRVTHAMAGATDVAAAGALALEPMCAAAGWEYGEMWVADADAAGTPLLVRGPAWHAPGDAALADFAAAGAGCVAREGEKLAGRAWATRAPVLARELRALADAFPRLEQARAARLSSGVAVPVLADGEVVAVLAFYMRDRRRVGPEGVELVAAVAAQVGTVVRRRAAEAALRASEERHRALFERSTAIQWVVDPGTARVVDANAAAARFYGHPLERLRGMPLRELSVLPEAAQRALLADAARGVGGVVPQRLASGDLRVVELHPTRVELGGRVFVHAVVHDVTERLRAESALRESEARFRGVLEAVSAVAVTLDADGRVTFANDALLSLSGWTREEAVGADWFARFVPPGAAPRRAFRALVAGGDSAAHDEHELLTRHGERRLVAWDHTLLRDGDGGVVGTASIGRDVTEQRALEQRLAALSEHDELTGLLNRRGFRRMADHELKVARPHGVPRVGALPRHGRLQADQRRARPRRGRPRAARGGRGAAADGARGRLRRPARGRRVRRLRDRRRDRRRGGGAGGAPARAAGARQRGRRGGRAPLRPRFSVGVATLEPGDDLDALLTRADGSLYARKLARRGGGG
jgi:PAS domain S-box-containing protein